MEELIRNSQENDCFFYIFLAILSLLAVGSNLFKKNISLLFSNKFEAFVENSFLFIISNLIFCSLSFGLFTISVMDKINFTDFYGIKNFDLLDRFLIISALTFLFLMARFILARSIFFIMNINPNLQYYFLLRSRYIIFYGFLLFITGTIINRVNLDEIMLNGLLIIITLVLCISFLISLYKRLSFLIQQTDIPLYYIILYLCTLELLPIGVIGKVLMISCNVI